MGKITKQELAQDVLDSLLNPANRNELEEGRRKLQKEVANLKLYQEASQRLQGGNVFATDGINFVGLNLDLTKATAQGALSVGTTQITLDTVTGFQVGQEITVYDDVNMENVTISAIDTTNKKITVTPLTKSYKNKASVARTTAEIDTTNKVIKVGKWTTVSSYTVNDETVVNQAYDTSDNGGRKIARTESGVLVFAVKNGTSEVRLYKKVGTNAPQPLASFSVTNLTDVAIWRTKGEIIGILYSHSGSTVSFRTVNAADGTLSTVINVDTGQTSFGWGGLSLIGNNAGTKLLASWTSTNSSYPQRNIRYVEGTINGDGSVTWDSPAQLTTMTSTGNYGYEYVVSLYVNEQPCIVANFKDLVNTPNDFRILFFSKQISGNVINYVATGWGSKEIYRVSTYAQSSPSACVAPNGRIWVTWHGMDNADTTYANIRVSYSDDGGLTWSAMTKLTSGNNSSQTNPSITVNKNNEVFVLWYGVDTTNPYSDIKMIKYSSGSWSNISVIAVGTTNNKMYPSTLYDTTLDFSTPLFIYKDQQGNKVGFYGTWTVGQDIPLLTSDVRFTLPSAQDIVAWVQHNNASGANVDASISFSSTESYSPMNKESITGEYEFTATNATASAATVKLTLTRPSTSTDFQITKILGGIE